MFFSEIRKEIRWAISQGLANLARGTSLASSAFGIARSTLDVDIVADVKPEQAFDISENLKEEFYVDFEMILNAIQKQSSFNLIHLLIF